MRNRDYAAAGYVAAAIACASIMARVIDPHFGFWGDNAESFAPLWHHVGTQLRQGVWTPMDPHLWLGGNVIAEAAYGIVNPASLVTFVLLSFFTDLSTGIWFVCTIYLALLGVATYALSRTYGATPAWALPFAVALPLGGFTFFYGASNWASGLFAITFNCASLWGCLHWRSSWSLTANCAGLAAWSWWAYVSGPSPRLPTSRS